MHIEREREIHVLVSVAHGTLHEEGRECVRDYAEEEPDVQQELIYIYIYMLLFNNNNNNMDMYNIT